MSLQADPITFLEIQGSTDLASRAEIIKSVRATGRSISERTLAYYISEGVIPKALRVGTTTGAYPVITVRLVSWVIDARKRGLAIESIRELVPVWKYLAKARRICSIELIELEYLARQHVTRIDANREIPLLVEEALRPEPADTDNCSRGQVSVTLKDGSLHEVSAESELRLGFVLTELDEQLKAGRIVAWTQLVLPGMGQPRNDDPATVILGTPAGTPLVDGVRTQWTDHASKDREGVDAQ